MREESKKIERFDGTNMVRWEPAMQSFLMSKKLWMKMRKIAPVAGETRGDATHVKRLKDDNLEEDNMEIIGKIAENVIASFQNTVLKFEYADEAWNYLLKLYKAGGDSDSAGIISKRKFYNLKMQEGENISNFLAEVYGHAQDLKMTDVDVREFVVQGGLPESFNVWMDTIKDNPTYAKWPEFRAKIEREGLQRGCVNVKKEEGKDHHSVMETKMYGKCYRCGQTGHSAQRCKGELKCFKCNRNGHRSFECKTGKDERGNKERGNSKRDFKKVQETTKKFVMETTRRNEETPIAYEETPIAYEEAPMAQNSSDRETVTWKYDTACSDHCTPRRDLFTEYERCDEVFYTAKRGDKMKIIGKGTVVLNTTAGLVELAEVLHCEELASNLLSGFTLQQNGVRVILGEEIVFEKKNIEICRGHMEDRAWTLKLEVIKRQRGASAEETKRDDQCLEHRRMGHVAKLKGDKFCDVCAKAKATANKKNKKSINRKPTRGLVHMDLFGPVFQKYFAVVIYDFTDEVAILPLKHKSEFFDAWTELAKLWSNQHEMVIKIIKCDGGGEFINNRMKEWCKKQGCELFIRNPYVKWQIGVVERRIRTIVEMANCMILDSGLEAEEYLQDAILTSVFLLNRQRSNFTGNIPAEERTGRLVDRKYFRVWGSRAFILIQKETRGKNSKFKNKAEEGILVGYSNSGYIIEMPDKRRIKSRDVKFNEDTKMNSDSDDSSDEEEESDEDVKPKGQTQDTDSTDEDDEEPIADEHSEYFEYPEEPSMPGGYMDPDERDERLREEHTRGAIDKDNIVEGKRTRKHTVYETYKTLSYKDAMQDKEKAEWAKAIELEFKQYCELGMFREVLLPKGRKAISTRVLMKRKEDGRFRPRLVARGFEQEYGLDYKEVFAPVANYPTFRLGIAIAASERRQVRTFDITSAYANSDVNEELYIEIPNGYMDFGRKFMKKEWKLEDEELKERGVLQILKTLQGIKQGAYNWYNEFEGKLKSLGFNTCKYEPCLFYQYVKGQLLLLILWVDDFLWIAPMEAEDLLDKIKKIYKVRETFGRLLGMNISQDEDGIYINSHDYIERKAKEFGVNENSIPCRQPMDLNLVLKKEEQCSKDPYLEVIGSLIHAINTTRADIAFPVGVLARFGNSYGTKHFEEAIRILRYLYTTKTKGLKFNYSKVKGELNLKVYGDADFAGDNLTGRSTSGVIISVNGTAVLWSSKLQSCVTKNTAEAELVATNTALDKLLPIREILLELGFKIEAVPLYQDNNACISILKKNEVNPKTRHMIAKFFYLAEQVEHGIIKMTRIDTKDQPADMMTKALNRTRLNALCYDVGLMDFLYPPNSGSEDIRGSRETTAIERHNNRRMQRPDKP